jgi:hypothetical protein
MDVQVPKWETLIFNNEYEIYPVYPHAIRHKKTKKIAEEKFHFTGFLNVTLDDLERSKDEVIALQWLPNPDNLPEVRHIDNNRANNRVSNLKWEGGYRLKWTKPLKSLNDF